MRYAWSWRPTGHQTNRRPALPSLELKPQPQVDIADPHGAFFSRLLRSANGELRIALNIGEGGATGVSRFLDTFGSAGFQQIALLSDDIFAAVEAAKASGVAFLPVPDNYYDDPATRFDIAPDLLARMRELGMLYDRVKNGEFFHIYNRAFRDRFFLEIVIAGLFYPCRTGSDHPLSVARSPWSSRQTVLFREATRGRCRPRRGRAGRRHCRGGVDAGFRHLRSIDLWRAPGLCRRPL